MGYVNPLEGNPFLPGWGPYVLDGFCVVFLPGFVQLAPRGLVPQAGFESVFQKWGCEMVRRGTNLWLNIKAINGY